MREEEEQQERWARQHLEELERQEGEQGWHSRVRSHLVTLAQGSLWHRDHPGTGVTWTHKPVMEGDTIFDLHFSHHSAQHWAVPSPHRALHFSLFFSVDTDILGPNF